MISINTYAPVDMTAYAIVQINITNPEDYKEYLTQVTSIVEKYGGEYIVRGGKFEVMLGSWDYERTVVIKFPSYDVLAVSFFSKQIAVKINKTNNLC